MPKITLNEALAVIKERRECPRTEVLFLVCGFQPLHLGTFLEARTSERSPGHRVEILTGLYGDFLGNLHKAADSAATGAFVVLEWGDIDSRLGLRGSGGWSDKSQADIRTDFSGNLSRLSTVVGNLAGRMPVALAPPSLPLPPLASTICAQAGVVELELEYDLALFLRELSQTPGIRILNRSHLEQQCSGISRIDPKMELVGGFPYTIPFASVLASALTEVLLPHPPGKGLITDLDDTLWAGIVGEVGADAVSWHLDQHAQIHSLYQQMLGHLADCGVLLGVCSKNQLAIVEKALARPDLLVDAGTLFPVRADWGPKSVGVREILRTWNIGQEAVVFVDDSPLDLAEVKQAFPGMTCLQFPRNDPARLWTLLGELRDFFGKPLLMEEDRLRSASIRSSAQVELTEAGTSSFAFLQDLQGCVTLDYRKNPADKRPLDLINKTNQFNLNGRRVSEVEWMRWIGRSENIVLTVSYRDKLGPLGKIAVLAGTTQGDGVLIELWVMSCRAFSRSIEFHTLDRLFRDFDALHIDFAFEATERNSPLQDFLRLVGFETTGSTTHRLYRSQFLSQAHGLPHQVSINLT